MKPGNFTVIGLIKAAWWIFLFVLAFRVLGRAPIGIVEEVLFLLVLIIVSTVSFSNMTMNLLFGRINYLQLILIPLLLLPMISAHQAQVVFKQPYLYGILAQRQHYILLFGYFIYLSLKNRWINLIDIEKYFLRSLYISLAIMYLFSLFIDPSNFKDTEFVSFSLNKGWRYEFPSGIVVTIMLFSIIKTWGEGKAGYYFPLLIAAVYFIVFAQDRTQIAFFLITVFVYYSKNLKLHQQLKYAFNAIIIGFAGLIIASILFPETVEHYTTMFTNAASIFTGEEVEESSTNARYKEIAIALENFNLHPWLGNGSVSSKFNGGLRGFFGYFYPGDIGILGNLFVYGIIGTSFYYILFFFSLRWSLQMKKYRPGLLMVSIYGMLFTFLDMITAASNIKFMGMQAFFFAIIYYYRFYLYPQEKKGLIAAS